MRFQISNRKHSISRSKSKPLAPSLSTPKSGCLTSRSRNLPRSSACWLLEMAGLGLGLGVKCRLAAVVVFSAWVGLAAFYELSRPKTSGCVMTYMYPNYIPIPMPENALMDKYGVFLYQEGWKAIDVNERLKKLRGVPVLFIPGNGGSYKQVRSLAAESSRAFEGGPPEPTFYKETSFSGGIHEIIEDAEDVSLTNQYNKTLDWFAVDLEGEHSAMDGRILEEHTEYVVIAIHAILDQYKSSLEIQSKEGGDVFGNLPTNVILVGHSMGGFVARAAVIHPHLRKSVVETILTLSTPHQLPPLPLQPSLGYFFSHVNMEWKRGYEGHINHAGHLVSAPKLSHVVIVSISGGIFDYQVRSKLASLDGIVPPSHGFMMSTSGIKNAWVTMDHQSILWCNQLAVKISHTLLSMINPETGKLFQGTQKRLDVFTKMLQSGIPQNFNWNKDSQPSTVMSVKDASCPAYIQWGDNVLEKDLYIQSSTVTILAMDGRRRWLDIKKLGTNGSAHFAFVTNLIPCYGVRLHLWPEKGKFDGIATKKIVEVTSKMVHIPSGPAPRQIEPGSQTEQAPPSALLLLTPTDMHGFHFLTISVAPRPNVSGRPPPAASMAVGQFFYPEEETRMISPWIHMLPSYAHEGLFLKEDHPLALNFSYSVSLGILPVTLSVQTVGCGIKNSALPVEQAGDTEQTSLCKLRCFPPFALAWDSTSGLHIIPNLVSETLVVDSSPAFWDLSQGSEKTAVLLLVDPHCSYKVTSPISLSTASGRLILSYSSQVGGFLVAVIFFAVMQQARSWELDLAVPSMLKAVELNLRAPLPFLFLTTSPFFVAWVVSFLNMLQYVPIGSLFAVSTICYLMANGFAIVLILSSELLLYLVASSHIFIKIRWQSWEENFCILYLQKIFSFSSTSYPFKATRFLKGKQNLMVSLIAILFVCLVHPAIGLLVLILFHVYCCHVVLCSFLAASFRSHAKKNECNDSRNNTLNQLLPVDEDSYNSPSSGRSFNDAQIEIFNYRHGMLMLHLVAALMFGPSLIAWLQRIGMSQSFPRLSDSLFCVGVIIHGTSGWKPDVSFVKFQLPFIHGRRREFGLSLVYLLSGYYSYICALASVPYRSFYALAAIGAISFASRIIEQRNGDRSESFFNNHRKHSHKH